MNPAEARVRELERRAVRLEEDILRNGQALQGVAEGLWDAWATGIGGGAGGGVRGELTITITGCPDGSSVDRPVEGILVESTIDSALTDASGVATLEIPGDVVTDVAVSDPLGTLEGVVLPEFVADGAAGTDSVNLLAAAGYQCTLLFSRPVPTTLTATDSVWGPVTLGWNGTAWVGHIFVNYPGYMACPASVGVRLDYTFNPNGTLQLVYQTTLLGTCPTAGAASAAGVAWTAGTTVDPPAFSRQFTVVSGTTSQTLYSTATPTTTVTVTG